jgi:hypothetical protein
MKQRQQVRKAPAKRLRSAARAAGNATTSAAAKRRAVTKAPRPTAGGGFSSEDMARILKLLKNTGSVELKLSVPAEGHRAAIRSLGLDPVEAQPRQAYFFDTADLALNRAGLIVRARRFQGGRADTVIKRRPVDPATIDPKLRRSGSFKIELDAMPGGYVCSASFKGACTGQEVLDVTSGAVPLRSLFSREQLEFYDAHAPKRIKMESLLPLGPIFLLKSKHDPKDFDRRVIVELWLYPDGSRILEVSTKCLPEEGFQVGAEFRAFLAGCGIEVGASQEAKTKAALEFFRARLEAGLPIG